MGVGLARNYARPRPTATRPRSRYTASKRSKKER
jgi:hypothetical protein